MITNDVYYGRIAYVAYAKNSKFRSLVSGDSLPMWEDLPPEIRRGWITSAKAVLTAYNKELNSAKKDVSGV